MVSRDINFIVIQLDKRIEYLENHFSRLYKKKQEEEDWDNETLLREWKISKRTAANYRKSGLDFYKRGGRIFYTAESRAKFTHQQKMKINGGTK